MGKTHSADKPRFVDERTKCQRRRKATDKSKNARELKTHDKSARLARVKGAGVKTKQQTCLDLLKRPEGATLEELQAATGWQRHSVRGLLAGAVKKKLGLTLQSEKPDEGPRRYRIPSAA